MHTVLQIFNSRIQKHGSFEDFMVGLAEECKRVGNKIIFVFPSIATKSIKENLEKVGAKVVVIKGQWESLNFVKQILEIIKTENINVIDIHFCCSLNFVLLFVILKILRKDVKILYHYHGEIMPIENLKFINHHFSRLRFLTLFVDKIIAVSEANKQFLKALDIRKEIVTIYNGVKIENFLARNKTDSCKSLTISNGEILVTTIGSLIPRKGIDVLLKSAEKVIREIPKVRFVIIGGGDGEVRYRNLAKDLGIEKNVIFTGLLKDYPFEILALTDLYVSSSYSESFGLSIAEAMAYEIPVVATKVGGVPEVVKDSQTGILVPPGDTEALAKGIIEMLKNERLRKSMGKIGKERVKNLFDLNNRVRELIEQFVT